MSRRSLFAVAVLLGAAAAIGGWLLFAVLAPSGGADPTDAEQVQLGERLYAQYCAACHGADLAGEPNWRERKADGTLPAPPHDATGHTWHHPDSQLFAYTEQGGAALAPEGFKSAMPGFGDRLSDAEIWAVLAYIKSRWPPEVRSRHEQISRRSGG